MGLLQKVLMPNKSKPKMMVAFCLMSIVPMLVGVYIASQFIRFPFAQSWNLLQTSAIVIISLILSLLGYVIARQMTDPVSLAVLNAKKLARGELDLGVNLEIKGSEELEDLSESLKAIAENARQLLLKVERISLKDEMTGLYNASYICQRLEEEITRAVHFQQPCSFAYFRVNNCDVYEARYGQEAARDAVKAVADVLSNNLPAFNPAARLNKSDLAVIFPGRNKKAAIEAVELIQTQANALACFKKEGDVKTSLSLCVGISSNPLDGVTADGLYQKAKGRMRLAKNSDGQPIEAMR